jgi:MYXO-CTERM domain-containing protein
MRSAALVSVFALLLTAGISTPAQAQPANKAEAAVIADRRMVNEYIDLGEYKTARDMLIKSLEKLKMAGSAVRPIAAETHVLLGVVYVLGFKETKKATEHFSTAISIQKDVALPKAANDRAKLVFGRAYEALHPTIKCDQLMGLFHKAVPLAQEGTPTVIEAKLGKHLVGGKMLVLYRGAAGGDFREAPLEKVEGCTYRGAIPADTVNAPKVEYYLEARLKDGRPSARRGKAKSPYIVNVSFGPVADAPEPDPAKVVVAEKEAPPEETKPKTDEVEDLLLTQPKSPKGSGCAGCQTSSSSGSGAIWLLALGALLLGRRRRS